MEEVWVERVCGEDTGSVERSLRIGGRVAVVNERHETNSVTTCHAGLSEGSLNETRPAYQERLPLTRTACLLRA